MALTTTQKGIKFLSSLKTVAFIVRTVLSLDNGDTITNPHDMANNFNNNFASIAETMKNIKYLHECFPDYFSNETGSKTIL